MGANLVTQVLAHWTHVSDRAFRVLVRMAVTAFDKPKDGKPAAVYHGGRDLLAMSLRSEKGSAQTRYRAVKRALAELTEAGAIQHVQAGWAGQNAVYRLTLSRSGSLEMGGPTSPPEGGLTSPPMGGPNGSKRGVSEAPPRNKEEFLEELGEEKRGDLQTASHPPREPEPPHEPEIAPVVEIRPGVSQEAPYVPRRRWTTRGADTVAEAQARVAARKAAHRAQQEAK